MNVANNIQRFVAFTLIVAGLLALMYGGFSFPHESHEAHIGSLHLSVVETKHVNVSIGAGIGLLLLGGTMLVWRRKSG